MSIKHGTLDCYASPSGNLKQRTNSTRYAVELVKQKMRFNALIRTHHITSRKKVGALKRAADTHSCWVLLRSGGCPGIMYVEGSTQDDVGGWVDVVRRLRYKDFQLVARPGPLVKENKSDTAQDTSDRPGLSEVDSVKEFGNIMEQKGIWGWWRKGMGYAGE